MSSSLYVGLLTLEKVSEMTKAVRLTIPVLKARELGLVVVDGIGGVPQFIGTRCQYEKEMLAVHYEVPGERTRAHA